jgi:hypothetical protein
VQGWGVRAEAAFRDHVPQCLQGGEPHQRKHGARLRRNFDRSMAKHL